MPPAAGYAKIRVDGATSRSLNEGSYCAVCRDDMGKHLGSSAIKCAGISDPASLEALACREALSLALDLNLSHVIIASDCQEVVTNINKGMGGLYASSIREIKATSTQFAACFFIFEGCDSNIEAQSR